MNCEKYDRDLLLASHGELGRIERLRLAWHLRRCTACQRKQNQWAQTSGAIAAALRPVDAPHWQPTLHKAGLHGIMTTKAGLLLTVFALFSLTLLLFRFATTTPNPTPPKNSRRALSPGCAPNLPSDRCR